MHTPVTQPDVHRVAVVYSSWSDAGQSVDTGFGDVLSKQFPEGESTISSETVSSNIMQSPNQ